jgi:DNA-binding LacI/PurR family transcriptional regulator
MRSGTQFTTYSIPREEMARQATAMLAERIESNSKGSQVLLSCEPVEGETLGTAPTGSGRK